MKEEVIIWIVEVNQALITCKTFGIDKCEEKKWNVGLIFQGTSYM